MSLLAFALAFMPAPTLPEQPGVGTADNAFVTSPVPRMCKDPNARAALPEEKVEKPRPLVEEPAATGYYAVMRIENGCTAPMKVNEAIAPSVKPQH